MPCHNSSLTDDLFHALAADPGHVLRAAQALEAGKGGGDNVLGVVGAQALGADVPDAGRRSRIVGLCEFID